MIDPSKKMSREVSFFGETLNFVQIGLGTNTTFVQNLAGDQADWSRNVGWLLEACSEWRPTQIRGIGLEPVAHLVEALQPMAATLPCVALVQAAIGEQEMWGAEVHVLESPDQLLQQVRHDQREDLAYELQFLRNMSCVGSEHRLFASKAAQILQRYGVEAKMSKQRADVWSYGRLVQKLNFNGTEVLMIDAEGHDASILRSVIAHCQQDPSAWPQVIQFETMGHCDAAEGHGAEWAVISELEKAGYMLAGYSHQDTHLVYRSALRQHKRLQDWAMSWVCSSCKERGNHPYTTSYDDIRCAKCTKRRSWDR